LIFIRKINQEREIKKAPKGKLESPGAFISDPSGKPIS
jgi:hypothetical protein